MNIYFLNPDCPNPQNPNGINFCLAYGSGLIFLLRERYRVLNLLGVGGFGRTFLAEDTDTPSNRRCVIKQLKPIANNLQIEQIVQERFQSEAVILEELGEENYHSSATQATLGKIILKLVVTDMKGKRISFWRATWRFLLILCFMPFNLSLIGVIIDCIPYLLKNKRSLQQIMSGTVVNKKNPMYP